MLHLSGLDPGKYWSDAIEAHVEIHNHMASHADPTTALEKATGHCPNVGGLCNFGCEALSYIEKDKRHKFDPKFEHCVNLGPSSDHSHLTYKLLNLRTGTELFRRHVVFNERSFPLRADNSITRPIATVQPDVTSAFDLLDQDFREDGKKNGKKCTVTSISKFKGTVAIDYIRSDGKEFCSTVDEVKAWIRTAELQQKSLSMTVQPKEFPPANINVLAYESFKTHIPRYNTT